MQLELDRVRPGEREGRGRTGSPLRPVGTRLGAASDGASIWGFGKLRGDGPGTQSGVVVGLGHGQTRLFISSVSVPKYI